VTGKLGTEKRGTTLKDWKRRDRTAGSEKNGTGKRENGFVMESWSSL